MTRTKFFLIASGLLALAGCDPYGGTTRPDYAIQVIPSAQGGTAIAPACPDFTAETADPYDNQPIPQYGCSSARNLAAMVDRPNDLIQPLQLGEQRGVTAVGAVRRYDNNQTRGLIWPGAEANSAAASTAPTTNSSMTGDITSTTSSAGSSVSSASSSGAAAGP